MAKSASIISTIRPGCVVEFMHGNQPQLAWVLEESSGKLRLLTVNQREVKLAQSRLLPWHGPRHEDGANRQEIRERLEEHRRTRDALAQELDIMEIWELAQGEVDNATVEWFTGLVWENPTPDQVACMGRALLGAKTHFKFQPPNFTVHPAEKVEQRLVQQEEDNRRQKVALAGRMLFKALWDRHLKGGGHVDANPDEEESVALRQLLLDMVADRADDNSRRIWAEAVKGLPDDPHLALLLAQQWGVLPEHHNHLMDEADYKAGDDWSAGFTDEINRLADYCAKHRKDGLTGFVSVDAATTRDIDDAFSVSKKDDGGYLLSIALARPVLGWDFDSDLAREVNLRATSLYLPEGTSHMMPEALGLDIFSLVAGRDAPSVIFDFDISPDGDILSTAPRLDWVRTDANVPYPDAETAIEVGEDERFVLAFELAQKLYQRRLEAGASVIIRPDPQVVLEGEGSNVKVRMEDKGETPKSELMISEFMILTNNQAAVWAKDNEVPLLHRTQAIALPSQACGEFSAPEDIFKVVKLLAPPLLETTPKRHAALAVDAYSPVTSPLRRITDFINCEQICSFLDSGEPRLDAEQLTALVPRVNARLQSVSQVQRFRPRYWKLLLIKQNQKTPRSAVLVEDSGPYPSLAMPDMQIYLRAPKKILGDKLYPGQRFQLKFGRVNPLTNEIKVLEALEE